MDLAKHDNQIDKNMVLDKKNGVIDKLRHNKTLLFVLIAAISFVIILVVTLVIILVVNKNKSEQSAIDIPQDLEYSIAPNPETGEPPLFGSDPNKDNSGEAFVEFEKRIIASSDYSIVVKNNARISIAVYYNAINKYDEAIKILDEIDTEDVFGAQLQQLYEVYANAYSGLGETGRADEYRVMAEQVEL